MRKVIQVTVAGRIKYHASHNPNNGAITLSEDINEASVFKSEWDMTFVPRIKEHIKREYPTAEIIIVNG